MMDNDVNSLFDWLVVLTGIFLLIGAVGLVLELCARATRHRWLKRLKNLERGRERQRRGE
jgi:hypothetical protein